MNDPLTVPARDGIEAQRGLNDIFPGDPYPVRDQLKRGLDALRAQASRGKISSADVFNLTDPLMDILARTIPAPSVAEAAEPVAWVTVPRDPTPEMVGAWYRVKNGHHFHDEPPPTNTSDYAAYRAMLAAAPPAPETRT